MIKECGKEKRVKGAVYGSNDPRALACHILYSDLVQGLNQRQSFPAQPATSDEFVSIGWSNVRAMPQRNMR